MYKADNSLAHMYVHAKNSPRKIHKVPCIFHAYFSLYQILQFVLLKRTMEPIFRRKAARTGSFHYKNEHPHKGTKIH